MTPMLYWPNVDAGPIFLSEVKKQIQSINQLLVAPMAPIANLFGTLHGSLFFFYWRN
jgi:hypothetical protein